MDCGGGTYQPNGASSGSPTAYAKLGEYEDEMICWRVQMEKELLAVREDETYFARVMNELKAQEAERAKSA